MIFGVKSVYADSGLVCTDPNLPCTCPPGDSYLDYYKADNMPCIGEFQISQNEAMNMRNIKKTSESLNTSKEEIVGRFNYVGDNIKDNLINKLDLYYTNNFNISTSTFEGSGANGIGGIARPDRDLFFSERYAGSLALSSAIKITEKYDNFGSLIQQLIVLVNSTEEYIKKSSIDMSATIEKLQKAKEQLNLNIDVINFNLSKIDSSINNLDINNFNSCLSFNYSYDEYLKDYKDAVDLYAESRNEIIPIAIETIQIVEAAYNGYSSITASPSVIYNDGSISVVTVTVKNSLNNPIVGRLVTLGDVQNASGGVDMVSDDIKILPDSIETNEDGIARFSVVANDIGYISLYAFIQDESLVISGSYLIKVIESLEMIGCQNSGGVWNFKSISCECPVDTSWDKDRLICISLSQIRCESGGGEWTGEMCKCKEGFIWDDKLLQCIKSEVSINEETCLNGGGIWDGSNCKCEDGFIWDEKELKCMESGGGVDEKTCINGGGEWTGKECICPEGTTWDEKELKCVEK